MRRFLAIAALIAGYSTGPAWAQEAETEAELYGRDVVAFVWDHCVHPMFYGDGKPDPLDLPLVSESPQADLYEADGTGHSLSVVKEGQEIPPGCSVKIFTQGPGDSVEIADERAKTTVQMLSGYIQNSVASDVSDQLRTCQAWENPGRFFQKPGLTAAYLSEDGSRTILVTGTYQGAMISISVMDFGPLVGCDG